MAAAQSARTHCPAGHPYDEENTLVSGGRRHCRACGRGRSRRAADRRRQVLGIRKRRTLTDAEIIAEHHERDASGCWNWTGAKHNAGYGQYGKPARLAHRISYEVHVGPIPPGLTIDHLCRNRRCVNPDHLEAVTLSENVLRGESLPARNARKTHCPKGHPYDDINTYIIPSTGHRQCRACIRERSRSRG